MENLIENQKTQEGTTPFLKAVAEHKALVLDLAAKLAEVTKQSTRGGWHGTGKRRKDMTEAEIEAVLGKEEYARRQAYYRQKAVAELTELSAGSVLTVTVKEVSMQSSKDDRDVLTDEPTHVLRAHCLTNGYHLLRVSNTTDFIEFRLDGGEFGTVTHYEIGTGHTAITIEIEPKADTNVKSGDRLNLHFQGRVN